MEIKQNNLSPQNSEKSSFQASPERNSSSSKNRWGKLLYCLKALLIPTLWLHWLATVLLFILMYAIRLLDLEPFIPLTILEGVCIFIISRFYARRLAQSPFLPAGWKTRWIPLLFYPMLTITIIALSLFLGKGSYASNVWGFYYSMNIPWFILVIIVAMSGDPLSLIAANLLCYLSFIFCFLWYLRKRRLSGSLPPKFIPVPKFHLTAAGIWILCVLIASGYGLNERRYIIHREYATKSHRGHYFEGGFSSIDLSPYHPEEPTNRLAKLTEPPTLKLLPREGSHPYPILDGAEAAYPLYAAVGSALYPRENWDSSIEFYNTIRAFERLTDQRDDIVFNAIPSPSQKELARSKNIELTCTPIAREAFVFFVHKDNPINNLSSKQLREIYSGKIRNWKEVGGDDIQILAFQRPPNSGSQTALEYFMEDTPLSKPLREELIQGMGGIIEQTAFYRDSSNALGFSFRYYATSMIPNENIKLLAIDGVEPSPENISSGEYPLIHHLHAITSQHSHPDSQAVIDWILSPQGRQIISQTGYIPLPTDNESKENKE